MDTNIIFNILKFADSQTALSILKAGGSNYFQFAKKLGIIKDIKIPKKSYFEVSFNLNNTFYILNHLLNKIYNAFQCKMIYGCACDQCETICKNIINSMINITHDQQTPDTRDSTLDCFIFSKNGRQNDVALISTNQRTFSHGIQFLSKLHDSHEITITSPVKVKLDHSTQNNQLYSTSPKFMLYRNKRVNTEIIDDILYMYTTPSSLVRLY